MEFDFTDEQQMIQDSAKRMVERDIQPVLDGYPAEKSLPREAMAKIYPVLATQGITAPRVPTDQGGSGMKMLDYALIYEQLPAWLSVSIMGHDVTFARIHAEATPEQRERFLPGMLSGEKIGGTATSEPNAGSDPRGLSTRMTVEGDTAVVNGRKLWITNGSVADILAVTCIDGVDEKGRNTLKRIIVQPSECNVEIREIETTGLKQGHLAEAVFADCEIPAAS